MSEPSSNGDKAGCERRRQNPPDEAAGIVRDRSHGLFVVP